MQQQHFGCVSEHASLSYQYFWLTSYLTSSTLVSLVPLRMLVIHSIKEGIKLRRVFLTLKTCR